MPAMVSPGMMMLGSHSAGDENRRFFMRGWDLQVTLGGDRFPNPFLCILFNDV
jgi:hypothetical protein